MGIAVILLQPFAVKLLNGVLSPTESIAFPGGFIMEDSISQNPKHIFRGELALLIVILMNSFGVVLMLYSGSGISAISSVPYAFSEVFPALSLGTWTYLFQALLIASLMLMRRRFVLEYLFSFVVGFAFSMMLDFYESWIDLLPYTPFARICYFVISYLMISLGIALSNRCGLPIIPTDLFPRELSAIKNFKYSRVKISFDVICLATTALITFIGLHHVKGLGIGTVVAAFTMGKCIGWVGERLDRHFTWKVGQRWRFAQ